MKKLLVLLMLFSGAGAHPVRAQEFLACAAKRPLSPLPAFAPDKNSDSQPLPVCTAVKDRGERAPDGSEWSTLAQRILHDLAGDDLVAFFGSNPHLEVAHHALPNAFAIRPDTIVVSSSLLAMIRSADEYAFVLAHESAHIALHHHEGTNTFTGGSDRQQHNIAREIEADRVAVEMLTQVGFDAAAGLDLLHRLAVRQAGHGISFFERYPSLPRRIAALEHLTTRTCHAS